MFLGAPDFARSEKKHSHRFSIFCVFTQPRSKADILRCSKERRYSITSSEIASTPDGMVKASALAVLRLITSSNVVGWIIGRSAGLVPLSNLLFRRRNGLGWCGFVVLAGRVNGRHPHVAR